MDDRLYQIATDVYGLSLPRIIEARNHFSSHYFLLAREGRYILSASRYQADRMSKGYQFRLMERLKDNGFGLVSLPVKTREGQYCQRDGDIWWVLKEFEESDPDPQWEADELISEAARTLADLHRAGRDVAHEQKVESEREDLGWYYLPSSRWADASEEISRSFRWSELSAEDCRFVQSQVEYVQSKSAETRERCNDWAAESITHQDYRPVNLRVLDSTITGVWDFDMAVVDYSLYDVAFAALQFGGRECLFPDISLEYGNHFVREYINATDKPEPFRDAEVIRWFLLVVVLRRLLLNYHVGERIELLRMVSEWHWPSSSGT